MKRREIWPGLIISLLYTAACLYALASLKGGWIDGVAWFSIVLMGVSLLSWLVYDEHFVRYGGGLLVRFSRFLLLAVQMVALSALNQWWAVFLRIAAEVNAEGRLLVANLRVERLNFRIDKDESGSMYIECGKCHRRSYHPRDIDNLYCACCGVFHIV